MSHDVHAVIQKLMHGKIITSTTEKGSFRTAHCFDMDAGVQEPVTLWLHRQPWDFYRQRKVLSVTGKVQVTQQLEMEKRKLTCVRNLVS
jgi:hypothetical protein